MTLATWAAGTPSGRAGFTEQLACLQVNLSRTGGIAVTFPQGKCGATPQEGWAVISSLRQIPAFPFKGPEKCFPARALLPFNTPNPPEDMGLSFQRPHLDMLPALPKGTLAVLPALPWPFFLPALQNSDKSDQLPFYHRYLHTLHLLFGWFQGSFSLQPAHLRAPVLGDYCTCSLGALPLQGPFSSCSWD